MTITIPRPSLVVLVGPAGSGKSTFAAAHFRPTAVVSSDQCRAMISDDPSNQRVSGDAFDLFHFIIDRRLKWRRLAVADSTALTRQARRLLLRIARDRGVPAVLLLFDVPLQTCLERDLVRPQPVGEEVVRRQYDQLEEARKTVREEGFDQVHVLREEDLRDIRIMVQRHPARH